MPSYKTVDLKVRPVHHRLESRVHAHVFLRMLAYYVEWHMRRALAPLLFDDDDPAAAEEALLRQSTQGTDDGKESSKCNQDCTICH